MMRFEQLTWDMVGELTEDEYVLLLARKNKKDKRRQFAGTRMGRKNSLSEVAEEQSRNEVLKQEFLNRRLIK